MTLWRAGLLAVLAAGAAGAQDFTTLKGHGGPIMGLDVGADGRVASASFDNSVGLWTGQVPIWLEGHDAAVTTLARLAPDILLSGGDDFALLLWDNAQPHRLGAHLGKIRDIAVAPDGSAVATASWDGTVGLWQIARSDADPPWNAVRRSLDGHDSGVNAVTFASDGRLYSAASDGTIRLWEDGGNTSRVLLKNGFGVNQLVLATDDAWLAYGAVDGTTRIVDPLTGEALKDFTLDRRPILALAHHPGTGQLAVGDGEGYIMIIDTDAWRIARDFRATRQGPIWALAYSPDGSVIYAGGIEDVVYAWPVDLLDQYEPGAAVTRSFLRDAAAMPNGERQFMRKCSICHALDAATSRKAGPSLYRIFGRQAGTLPGYRYSGTLEGSSIVWSEETIDALFDIGPDHYIPGSKMPMQVIASAEDRRDLIEFLRTATTSGE